jgi:hypothetical protein
MEPRAGGPATISGLRAATRRPGTIRSYRIVGTWLRLEEQFRERRIYRRLDATSISASSSSAFAEETRLPFWR